ncbi:MAG: hypothetical protein R3D68_08290 [Hyphomicrobiaceae bacterium]
MSKYAHTFVALIFVILGLSFLLSTGTLVYEFWNHDWQALLFAHSHLFFFFPIFGILALVAFYIPAVAFTDYYWRHARAFGGLGYLAVFLVLVAASVWQAMGLAAEERRGIWEISPAALAQDKTARPARVDECLTEDGARCLRQSVMPTLDRLRAEGNKRSTLTAFARSCRPDLFIERPASDLEKRYCFPADAKLDADACCKVQQAFSRHVAGLALNPASRSLTSRVEEVISGFKVFFILILLVMGIVLIGWQHHIVELYDENIDDIERGVIIGAFAMVFWLLMDYAYQQTGDVLFGRNYLGVPFRRSIVIAPWAVLLIVYFVRRVDGRLFSLAQLSTIGASLFAVFNYELITSISVRVLGAGAAEFGFGTLLVIALVGLIAVLARWDLPLPAPGTRPPAGGRGPGSYT